MKNTVSKYAILFLLFVFPLQAQETEQNGFINVVNLIPPGGHCTVLIDTHDLMPGGLKSGTDSGWFSMPKRNVSIEIESEGAENASGTIELIPGTSQVVAIFLQPNPRKGNSENPAPPLIKIKRFPSFDGSAGHSLKLASTCELETRFVIAGKSFSLIQFQPVEIPGWTGSGFKIEREGKKIGAVSDPNDKGSYYLLFGNHGEQYVTALVLANTQKHLEPYVEPDSNP